jgi:GNAT superfamily N-acetyltransferase
MDVKMVKVDGSNVDDLARMITELAVFEHLVPPTPEAVERLRKDVASNTPYFQSYIAYMGPDQVGYVFYFFTYSTLLAKPTLFIEDIYVVEKFRRHGIGRKLLAFCAAEAERRGCGRMDWNVLDWNSKAISFYQSCGATVHTEWSMVRLLEKDFKNLL